jgi:hypothetical protein
MLEKVFWYCIAAILTISLLQTIQNSLDERPQNNVHSDQVILLVMDGLRANNPEIGETCIVVAANLLVGDYNTVEHMMPVHGKCATKLIGLYVSKDQL